MTARRQALLRLLRLAVAPRAYSRMARDALRWRHPVGDDAEHLHAAVAWLLRAQAATRTGGVSAWYCLGEGWHAPYPETTGYIIPTCLEYAARYDRADVREAACRMGAWTLTCQTEEGGVRGGTDPKAPAVVFNTGQCMQGWLRLAESTGEERWRDALRKAGAWLVAIQDADGQWSRSEYRNEPHAYHSLVAWPLFEAAEGLGIGAFRAAAERNVDWCLAQAQDRSWIRHMAFADGEPVLTHTLAYTYHGLLECSTFLDGPRRQAVLGVVQGAAERLLHLYERRKATPYGRPRCMPATVDERWLPTSAYSCVTGNAQIAGIWLRLFRMQGDARLLNASLKILDQVKSCQDRACRHPGIRGGVPSSWPLYGGYLPLRYLNWAAKFLADALMLNLDALRSVDGEAPCASA